MTGGFKGLQGVTEGNKRLQGVTRGYRGLQGFKRVTRDYITYMFIQTHNDHMNLKGRV